MTAHGSYAPSCRLERSLALLRRLSDARLNYEAKVAARIDAFESAANELHNAETLLDKHDENTGYYRVGERWPARPKDGAA